MSDAFKLLFVLSLKIYLKQTEQIAKLFVEVFYYTESGKNFKRLFNCKIFPNKRSHGKKPLGNSNNQKILFEWNHGYQKGQRCLRRRFIIYQNTRD